MTVIVSLPAEQLHNVHANASVDSVSWWCRLCTSQGSAPTQSLARSTAIEHLTRYHQAQILGD